MRTIYISGPLRGATPYKTELNIRRARAEAERLWSIGFAVLCPHLNTYGMVGMLEEEEQFIEGDLALIKGIDIVYMLRGWTDSIGASKEYAEAIKLGKKILYQCSEESDSRLADISKRSGFYDG